MFKTSSIKVYLLALNLTFLASPFFYRELPRLPISIMGATYFSFTLARFTPFLSPKFMILDSSRNSSGEIC